MLDPFSAASRIVDAITALDRIEQSLATSDTLVLAKDVVSPVALPLWANSAMDGYACRREDVAAASESTPVTLRVVESVRAGQFPTRDISAGEATRIATGAPTPAGADSVVRVEDTDGGADVVSVRSARDAGRNVRPAGEDVSVGSTVVAAGTVLGPAQIAVLASVGAAQLSVHRRPRVAVIATGDELVPIEQFDEVLAGKRIVSSNSYGLCAAIRAAGAEAVNFGIVPDDPAPLRAAIERAATECDLIITSAGVSVGEADYIKTVVGELGGTIDFWRVRMRPGSPLAFGSVRGTPWIGLPGNPVSSLVTFELFARPAIAKLAGKRDVFAPRVRVVADEAIAKALPVTQFYRVRLARSDGGLPRARLTGPQPSNILSSLSQADALLIVPPDHGDVRVGQELDALLLR